MAYCYILFSKSLNRFYTGVTSKDVNERLAKHNHTKYGNHRYTAKASDWSIFLAITVDTYDHAIRLEKKIKAQKSAKYIRNLKKYPELIEKIVSQTLKT